MVFGMGSTKKAKDDFEGVDYYELLGVEVTAKTEDIKKAFRKKALEYHPDKNRKDDPEVAKRKFQHIQQAWDVLSDPQERAWYDGHKDQILGSSTADTNVGGKGAKPKFAGHTPASSLMRYFSSSLFTSSNFISIYANIFTQILKEEIPFNQAQSMVYYGDENTSYDPTLKEFYGYFTGFSTSKTFVWEDKYRLPDAPDRRIRRLMEKENAKARADAKKEFNDTVRALALFVQKRDPRFKKWKQEQVRIEKLQNEAMKAQEDQRRKQKKNRPQATSTQGNYQEQDWTKVDYEKVLWFGSSEEDSQNELASDEEREEEEGYYCPACQKSFMHENQWENHQKSKKHIKALENLKKMMKADAELAEMVGKFQLDGLKADEQDGDEGEENGDKDVDGEDGSGSEREDATSDHDSEEAASDVEETSDRGSEKNLQGSPQAILDSSDSESLPENGFMSKKSRKTRRKNKMAPKVPDWNNEESETEVNVASNENEATKSDDDKVAAESGGEKEISTVKEKKKRRRRKDKDGPATSEMSETPQTSKGNKSKVKQAPSEFKCRVCKVDCGSRNKLFEHVRKTGHATAHTRQMKKRK